MKVEQLPELTQEEIQDVQTKFFQYMELHKENVKDQFLKALWKGVGKLDTDAAKIVYQEVSEVCNGPLWCDGMLQAMGIDLDYPFSIDETVKIYERAIDIGGCGHIGGAKVTRDGNTLKLEFEGYTRCGCAFVTETPLKMFERNENQCEYCSMDGFKVWFETLLRKSVEIRKGERDAPQGWVYGGVCDNWIIEVKE